MKLHPFLCKCWMKRGQQKRIPAPGQQQTCHIFGAYNWLTDEVIWTHCEHKNTAAFMAFIEHFMSQVRSQLPIVLVMDNASFHHSRDAEATLAFFEADGLVVTWLPPYCSDLNPIERFWLHLKHSATANKLFACLQHLVDSVEQTLHLQNDFSLTDRFLFLKTYLV